MGIDTTPLVFKRFSRNISKSQKKIASRKDLSKEIPKCGIRSSSTYCNSGIEEVQHMNTCIWNLIVSGCFLCNDFFSCMYSTWCTCSVQYTVVRIYYACITWVNIIFCHTRSRSKNELHYTYVSLKILTAFYYMYSFCFIIFKTFFSPFHMKWLTIFSEIRTNSSISNQTYF